MAKKAETVPTDLSKIVEKHGPALRQHLIDHIQKQGVPAGAGAAPAPGAPPGAPAATGVGDVIQIVDTVMKYLPQVDAFIKNLRKRRKG
jgi:hypothetical protein